MSADGGATWHTAELQKVPQKRGRGWAWALWSATIPVPSKGPVELVAKATDESYNTQASVWRGQHAACSMRGQGSPQPLLVGA